MISELEFGNQEREKEEEEYVREQARWSRAAKRILNDDDIMELFDMILEEYRTAFKTLPLDASLDEYRTVHFGFLAIEQLMSRLSDFIVNNELSEQQRKIDAATEGVNV